MLLVTMFIRVYSFTNAYLHQPVSNRHYCCDAILGRSFYYVTWFITGLVGDIVGDIHMTHLLPWTRNRSKQRKCQYIWWFLMMTITLLASARYRFFIQTNNSKVGVTDKQ